MLKIAYWRTQLAAPSLGTQQINLLSSMRIEIAIFQIVSEKTETFEAISLRWTCREERRICGSPEGGQANPSFSFEAFESWSCWSPLFPGVHDLGRGWRASSPRLVMSLTRVREKQERCVEARPARMGSCVDQVGGASRSGATALDRYSTRTDRS